MSDFSLDAAMLDWILGLVALEALVMIGLRFFLARGPRLLSMISTLVAGACLLIAVRGLLSGASSAWIGLWLFLGCLAHCADILMRWQQESISHKDVSAHPGTESFLSQKAGFASLSPLHLTTKDEASHG